MSLNATISLAGSKEVWIFWFFAILLLIIIFIKIMNGLLWDYDEETVVSGF